MGKTPQGRFQAPDDDGNIAIGLPDSVAVDNHRPVGTLAHHASRRIVVVGPFLQGNGVMRYHGVNVSGGHQKSQPGLSEFFELCGGFIVGLRQYGHPKACFFQHP